MAKLTQQKLESHLWGAANIRNTGTNATSSWKVVLDAKSSVINNLWNGAYTKSGSQYTVTSTWNGVIPPSGSTTFGFCANKTGTNYTPVILSAGPG